MRLEVITTVEAAINRIRPILLEVLEDRWWQGNRRRPIPLMDEDETLSQYAHIALLVDSTSVEVFRPNNSLFEEGKHYFDGKNRIYALKKEVAVMASPPHFALFSFPGAPGARHDYSILKEHYSAYIPYLTKSAQETAMIHRVDGNETSWSALFDKGYVGPAQDTPGFRRITIKKQSQVRTAAERFQNRELSQPILLQTIGTIRLSNQRRDGARTSGGSAMTNPNSLSSIIKAACLPLS
ncbi:Conserved oligomeric Golgi complex subunit 3 [Balamuthia mandrillaris]